MKVFASILFAVILVSLPAFIQTEEGTALQKKSEKSVGNYPVIPFPKEIQLEEGYFTFEDSLEIFISFGQLEPLVDVLEKEFKSLYFTELIKKTKKENAKLILEIDDSLGEESYRINIDRKIEISGGSYNAVAMGTVSVLQSITEKQGRKYVTRGSIYDFPDLSFRGLLVDVARREHHISVLKQIVSLCRWYKIKYLHLHLTDDNAFRFPSKAYPQLISEEFSYEEEELAELIAFADARGVEIIPELEVPGHARQMIERMPDTFGFRDDELNRNTINMANEAVYPVLDTLIGEIADLFYSSRYIHIGGDEPDFRGMEEDLQMQQYLKAENLASVEELYWQFINRMHEYVEKRGRKTIVWEGFSREGNEVVSKDIIVMAWESLYQLPTRLLEAGYEIINVSWKPLYVVNTRKWDPLDIFHWNVYQWQNWLPRAPSYDTIQIEKHDNVLGASMASWDQPEYTEISSLRRRLPAMVQRVWNVEKNLAEDDFQAALNQLDVKLSRYFSPVSVKASGLSFPQITDGRMDEQVWFDDTLYIQLKTPSDLITRYTTDGTEVKDSSPVFENRLKFSRTTTLRYRAYTLNGEPVGQEILHYYELNPLKVEMRSKMLITEEERWKRPDSWRFPFYDSLTVHITSKRPGVIRFTKGENALNANSPSYEGPITIKDDVFIKAGLFKADSLIGQPWRQHFRKINHQQNGRK